MAQACQNNLPVPQVLQSLSLLSLRSQTGIFSCPSVILSPSKCDTSEIHDVWLRAEESLSLFKKIDSILSWCSWGYSIILLLSSTSSPKRDSEGVNNSHRTEQLNIAVTRKERRMLKSAAWFNVPCAFVLQSKGELVTSVLKMQIPFFLLQTLSASLSHTLLTAWDSP